MARSRNEAKARADLRYHERIVNGDDVVFVQDPVRGNYVKFNPLQAAMLRALDGKRTPTEVAAALSVEFDVEIPPEATSRFVVKARDLMLLDITSYDATPDAARVAVRKALRKAGFHMRSTKTRDPSRSLTQESMLFAEAFRQLDLGLPLRAAECLAEIRERNPRNLRAKQLYELIQAAYIQASGTMSDQTTYPWFNPNRPLRFLSNTVGRFMFGWPGIVAILVMLYVGVHAYTLIAFDKVTVSALSVVVAIGVTVVANMVHELSHGFACQYYGGDVTEIGFMMFYFYPAPYCDTSSSYLIESRRHKVTIQLAGTIGSIVFIAIESMLLAMLDPEAPFYSGIALSLIFQLGEGIWGLIPFMKTDGYYAICDYYHFPNLKERGNKIATAWLSKRILGIDLETEELPRRTHILLVMYGITAYLVATFFAFSVLTRLLAPVVEHFQGPGLLFVVFLGAYLMRRFTFLPLRNLVKMVVRERQRIFTFRRSASFVLAMVVLVLPWFLRWPVLVDADFVVLPQQRGEVRAQTSGRVEQILVKEGDRVRRGDPLAKLSNVGLDLDIARAEAALAIASEHLAELQNGARPEELALARRHVERANSEAARSASEAGVALELAAANLGPRAGVDSAEEKFATSAGSANAARISLSLVEAGAREEEIAMVKAEQKSVASRLAHLRSDHDLLVLRSPIDGIVATPHLDQKLQDSLVAGGPFAVVHDLSAGVAEIALSQSDPLGEIGPNDEIELRLYGDPKTPIHVRVDRSREIPATNDEPEKVVIVTSSFHLDRLLSGVTGHARIYGAEHSLAYNYFVIPFHRLLRVRLWSMW